MQANVLESIVSTIVAAQYPTASSDQRNAAAHALTQVSKATMNLAWPSCVSGRLHIVQLRL
jgi:hypothetical protein